MHASKSQWAGRSILLALVLIAGLILRPYLLSSLRTGAGLVVGLVYLLAYLFAVALLPLIFFTLMRFAYSVFLRPYVRAWHIHRIRNKRQLKEVLQRSRKNG